MKRPSLLVSCVLATALGGLSAAALAHTGGDAAAHHGFSDGWLHPFTGLDHLAAMLAVGFWSAASGRRPWTAPLAFTTLLLGGALAGLQGVAPPAVEPMIAASLLVLGLLVATRTVLPGLAAGTVAGGFALFHGAAHGMELAGAAALPALAGMLLATLLLHAAGMALGYSVALRSAWWPRLAGGAVAAFGAALLLPLAHA